MGRGMLAMFVVLAGGAAAAASLFLKAAARKLKQVHKSLEAAEYAYSTQAAHAAELEQRVNQLAGQLPEVQDDLVTGRQQQAELQQQLSAAQAKICSTLQQLMQLNDSLATLKAKCVSNDRTIDALDDEAMLLQQRTQEAEQELETATSCHQAKIAELNDQCSSLLKTFLALRYQHNDMLQRLAETKEWRIKAEEKALQTISRLRDQEECNTHLLRQLEAAKCLETTDSCDSGSTTVSQSSSDCGDGDLQTEDSSVDLAPPSPCGEMDIYEDLQLDECSAGVSTLKGFRGLQVQLDLAHVARVNWVLDAVNSGSTAAAGVHTA